MLLLFISLICCSVYSFLSIVLSYQTERTQLVFLFCFLRHFPLLRPLLDLVTFWYCGFHYYIYSMKKSSVFVINIIASRLITFQNKFEYGISCRHFFQSIPFVFVRNDIIFSHTIFKTISVFHKEQEPWRLPSRQAELNPSFTRGVGVGSS